MSERFFPVEASNDDDCSSGGGYPEGGIELDAAIATLSRDVTMLDETLADGSLTPENRARAAANARRKLDTLLMLITDEANRKYEESKKDGLSPEQRVAILRSALADIETARALRTDVNASLEAQREVLESAISELDGLPSETMH